MPLRQEEIDIIRIFPVPFFDKYPVPPLYFIPALWYNTTCTEEKWKLYS